MTLVLILANQTRIKKGLLRNLPGNQLMDNNYFGLKTVEVLKCILRNLCRPQITLHVKVCGRLSPKCEMV